jgi:hypothetical protein
VDARNSGVVLADLVPVRLMSSVERLLSGSTSGRRGSEAVFREGLQSAEAV